ncbi:MAG: hypothetical protein M1838_001451 [Thelocarpon superellum]|nr:MAG: hypothetical protein M1838_001451 [Thelocarpon superellum]
MLSPHTASSPATAPSENGEGGKPKKAPSVTPRTFRRFFTPRSSVTKSGHLSAARQALRDITTPALNGPHRRHHAVLGPLAPFPDLSVPDGKNEGAHPAPHGEKRRIALSPDPLSPDHRASRKRRTTTATATATASFIVAEDRDGHASSQTTLDLDDSADEDDVHQTTRRAHALDHRLPRRSVASFRETSISARLLQRSFEGLGGRSIPSSCASWQNETADFFSRADDSHACTSVARPGRVPPFCAASCNTNALVAVGDEQGGIRLLESAKAMGGDAFLGFQAHDNAILDLSFSFDDKFLATASGDQTAKVIDMRSQRAVASLEGHTSSVKQVRFQPGSGSNHIVATSSRDANVHIWDLRCRGTDGPVRRLYTSLTPADECAEALGIARATTYVCPVNSMVDAHPERRPARNQHGLAPRPSGTGSTEPTSRGESPGSSVTALSFLPPGREHLLLTASEGNACIKLWDLRTSHHPRRRGRAVPLSTTRQPDSHDKYRHFGVNALALSGDGARLYSLCRDNTVYAYSSNHLILGHAPELSSLNNRPRRSGGNGKEGLGPLYGFRHEQMHTATFYVKLSLRKAQDDRSELLAIGSSDGCAVLFPTHESYLNESAYPPKSSPFATSTTISPTAPIDTPSPTPPSSGTRGALTRSTSGTGLGPGQGQGQGLAARLQDTIPIYGHGTVLGHGHTREVTGVAWTVRGDLVSVGDDFLARCWREDGAEARDLRRYAGLEGRGWGCGWAEVEEGFDDDEDEDGS